MSKVIVHRHAAKYLKRLPKETQERIIEILKELEAIRSGAIAYSHEENDEGLIAMAVPVFDLSGNVTASIVVPVPTLRFNAEKERTIERALREAGATLSYRLGFDKGSRAVVGE